ncbi:replication initiation protein [Aliarcobacter butzleri]|uniref:primase C-terminal domain-containing protein n=1 Tax=Aliarcobacter butzleri TaxID=28197 RepID=UPI00263F3F39|nr:primase C-terminal domain-containing protein [Aliarcobacter butzleri]MDN5112698.1 replication initiation protein [Aliarcobacter butzleri]
MTYLTKYTESEEQFFELFIKNLPPKIKAGNEKHLSNIFHYSTFKALKKCKFININTKERISFLVFDIDKYEDKTALEYFKNIDNFLDYIIENIGLEPTYILETSKGFHFAFHLKNHIYTSQQNVLNYVINIKKAITDKLKCDEIASNRLYGVWRNPLLHNCYFSECINYELKDFKKLFEIKINKNLRDNLTTIKKIDINEIVDGNRNNKMFEAGMRFAKNKQVLDIDDILLYLISLNQNILNPLPSDELLPTSKSIYKYWNKDLIRYGSIQKNENINVGIMSFKTMKNLSYGDYIKETRRRQSLSAKRTNEIVENRRDLMLNAKQLYIENQAQVNYNKVQNSILELEKENKKITVSSISKLCELDRRTVKKYYIKGNIN